MRRMSPDEENEVFGRHVQGTYQAEYVQEQLEGHEVKMKRLGLPSLRGLQDTPGYTPDRPILALVMVYVAVMTACLIGHPHCCLHKWLPLGMHTTKS